MIALTIYLIRRYILQPLGLVKPGVNNKKEERTWLESIGYYTKDK